MSAVPEPSVKSKSFACPHCGAHADQVWHDVHAASLRKDDRLPYIPEKGSAANARRAAENARNPDEEKLKALQRAASWSEKMEAGEPFLHWERYVNSDVVLANVFASACHTCHQVALWVHDRLIYPPKLAGPAPSQDLPDELRADYEEARRIADLSPRGAAALLRLVVQKLCAHLGEKGKNIDDDIAAMVAKGLDPSLQQALDSLRIIGNEAVHPGQMDLRDDRETALVLFELVNDIAAQMITRPKRAAEVYGRLPPSKLDAIAKRDGKPGGSTT